MAPLSILSFGVMFLVGTDTFLVAPLLPELTARFDAILVAEDLGRSKPHPDGYLRAAERLGVSPTRCVVFEDSFTGLEAGRRAGGAVVGLATTNPAEAIADRCDRVIDDFRTFTVDDMVSLLQTINRR